MESITTCFVHGDIESPDIFARVPLWAVVRRVYLTNHPIHFDLLSLCLLSLFLFFQAGVSLDFLQPGFFAEILLIAKLLSSMLVLIKNKIETFSFFLHQIQM